VQTASKSQKCRTPKVRQGKLMLSFNCQQAQSDKSQSAPLPFNGPNCYQQFKCSDGLECRLREWPGLFVMDGMFSIFAAEGELCSLEDNIVCRTDFACVNDTC
jgi:hypothetical protein